MKEFRITLESGIMHYMAGTDSKSARVKFEKDYPELGKVRSVRFLRIL